MNAKRLFVISSLAALAHSPEFALGGWAISATVQKVPPQITLHWVPAGQACGHSNAYVYIFRRTSSTEDFALVISRENIPDSGSYEDTNVLLGQRYEYKVIQWACADFPENHLVSGIEVPLTESRGKVILIIDDTYAFALEDELGQLYTDLVGDGWTVISHYVSRSDTPPNVKTLIQADYNADPVNVQAVILIGHVPVPYSGFSTPGGHREDLGAHPADVYYGDMTGTWTDTVDYTMDPVCHDAYGCATDPRLINVPGDGKFDQNLRPRSAPNQPPSWVQDLFPGQVALQVGRIDLANMPAFAPKTELDLLRQYLNKDHTYRQGGFDVRQRGYINDAWYLEYGWDRPPIDDMHAGMMAPLVGLENIDWNDSPPSEYMVPLSTQSYLWSYGAGPGWYQGAAGIGTTTDFATYDPKAVFTMLWGSFFADWDEPDNFLRAPLATASFGLASIYGTLGAGNWLFHYMGMGETIGHGVRLSFNSDRHVSGDWSYPPYSEWDYFAGLGWGPTVWAALMGDPTLRLYPIAPPSQLKVYPNQSCAVVTRNSPPSCVPSPGVATLTWLASPDKDVIGYNLYKTDEAHPSWTRVNQQPISGTSYIDVSNASRSLDNTNWMLRAVKLQTSPSGTYYDASEGIFATTYACGLPNSLWGCGALPCQYRPQCM